MPMITAREKDANSNASFFVKRVCGKCPQSLDDLKYDICNGDFEFLYKLLYFSGSLEGTDSFWRRKREELNEWMLYHIEHKRGPPTLFITLSCAEYWWPDLIKLLCDRLRRTMRPDLQALAILVNQGDRMSVIKAINNHTSLVQQFFHMRVEQWMKTVGKELLGIDHYWAAFEFATGHGQIHIHMLAITKSQIDLLTEYHSLRKQRNSDYKRIALVSDYVRTELELTANHPGYISSSQYDTVSPDTECFKEALKRRFIDSCDDISDQRDLSHCCQLHTCNSYCMRNTRKPRK